MAISRHLSSAVTSKAVVVLEDFAVAAPAAGTEGRDSNFILWEVLGVPERPQVRAGAHGGGDARARGRLAGRAW